MRRRKLRGIDPSKGQLATYGVIAAAVILVATFFGFTKWNPFADPFELKAAFRTANDIRTDSPVRIAGVNVGKVTKVEGGRRPGEGAIVTMEIEDAGLPIHKDARMKIRPRIFLEGNYFVDLRPGSPSAPVVEEGEIIPATQTAAPVQLGQVLNILTKDTRQDLQAVFRELGRALTSKDYKGSKGFNQSIRYWEEAFRNSAITSTATRGLLERDLSNYIRNAGAVAAALDRNRSALQGLITDLATTADALAQEETSLSAAINELPRFLSQGRGTLSVLNDQFPRVRAFVADMRPAVRSSGPTLDAQERFLPQAARLMSRAELRGLVADLRPTVPSLVKLNKGGIPLQQQARLLGSCQLNVMLPTANKRIEDPNFPATGRVYQEAVKWLPGIAGESRSFDANGQYVKTLATANYAYPVDGGRFFLTPLPVQGVNPPKSAMPPIRRETPCETQQPPDLRTRIQPPPAGFRISQSGPGYAERYAAARERAIEWLRDDLERLGLPFEVSTQDLTSGQLAGLLPAQLGVGSP